MLAVRTMAVAPVPIFPLVSPREPAVFAMRAMSFDDPGIVITDFRIVPDVVIAVVWVVNAVADTYMSRATGQRQTP